jgi:hypothetical protein
MHARCAPTLTQALASESFDQALKRACNTTSTPEAEQALASCKTALASERNFCSFVKYRQPLLPASITLETLTQLRGRCPQAARYAEDLHARLRQARSLLQQAQERMKTYADAKRREVTYEVGERVLLSTENFRFKVAGARKLMSY